MTKYAVFSRGHNKDNVRDVDETMEERDVEIHERYAQCSTFNPNQNNHSKLKATIE